MTDTMRQLPLSEFPDALHDAIADRLALYTIGFSALTLRDRVEHSAQSGSGTLVRFDGRYAVLTADHVADQLKDCDRVGMLVDIRGGLRRCAFERAHLTWLRIGTAPYGSEGPDITVNVR
jgi:hypothetical protein